MKQIIKIGSLLLISILVSTIAFSQEANPFKAPAEQALVVDYANVLSPQQENALKAKLHQFSNETSTQVLIYTTPDLQGYDVADFAQRLGEGWGVGQKGFDNGIVIVFKPKVGNSPGRITLQTGYGIEPLIPDATANQIINNEMIPAFKTGNIYRGIDAAINTCISLTKEEFTAQAYAKQTQSSGGGFIFFVIMAIVMFSILGRSRSSRHYNTGSRSNLGLFAAMMLMGSGSHRGSGFNSFSSGSGSFGGGGGFGGFGGGGFGGGGASGSW